MSEYLLGAVAALVWLAALARAWQLRRGAHVQHCFLVAALAALALALTTQVPGVYLWIGDVAHVPNLAAPLGHGSVLVTAWAATSLLAYSALPQERATRLVRRRLAVLLAALVGLVALFVIEGSRPQVLGYDDHYGHDAAVAGHYLIYVAYLAVAGFDLARNNWRYARVASGEPLRVGLRLISLAGVVVMAYAAFKCVSVLARFIGTGSGSSESPLSDVLIALAGLLAVAGTSAFAWSRRLRVERFSSWLRSYGSYRRLSPLWWDLYRVEPDVALYLPSQRLLDAVDVRDLDFRLHRRVVEIRDAWLALRPYLDAEVARRVRESLPVGSLPDEDVEARVQAEVLAQAVAAKTAGRRAEPARDVNLPGAADATDELRWLEKVATAYRRRRRVAVS